MGEVRARCGHHPDRDATGGTCGRCGTFTCDECWVGGAEPPLCRPCLRHLDAGPHLKHAKVLGVVMMVHGALMAGLGAYYLVFGGFFVDALRDTPHGPEDLADDRVPLLIGGALAVFAMVHVVPGVLQALAGWQVFRLRSAGLGLAAALVGLLATCGLYCVPSALVVAAYGVYVLTRDDVRARFAVRVPSG